MTSVSLFGALLLFMLWSAIVFIASEAMLKWLPGARQSPRLWLALIFVCFLPLLPQPWPTDYALPQGWSGMAQETGLILASTLTSVPGKTTSSWSPWFLIFLPLAMVSAWKLCQLGLGIWRARNLCRQAMPMAVPEFEHAPSLPGDLRLRLTREPVSAFAFGFFKPAVVIPEFVLTLPQHQQALLIAHEATHIQARDPQKVILLKTMCALFWFNPVITRLERHFTQAMELACDHKVIRSAPSQKLEYARALLSSLKQLTAHQAVTAHFSDPQANKRFYQDRLEHIMTTRPSLSFSARLVLLGFFLISALCVHRVQASLITPPGDAWILPAGHATISSGYGKKEAIRKHKAHLGIDFPGPVGSPVYASQSGKVIVADAKSLHRNYGKVILLQHADGTQSLYAHLNAYQVTVGERVLAGQKIGQMGKSGRVTGPHLHFEIIQDGNRLDPGLYLPL